MRAPARTAPGIALLAALGLVCVAGIWWTGPCPGPRDWPLRYLRGYGLAWVAYIAAGTWVTRTAALARAATRGWLVVILALALIMRVVAIHRTPKHSTDIYRYLWDGRVANAGLNPYQYPPAAPELAFLRDVRWKYIYMKDLRTCYPPAAELVFAALVRVAGPSEIGFRWVFLGCDLAVWWLLMALLRRSGRAPERVIWYAWCPLVATEGVAGPHIDVVALGWLSLALLLALRQHRPGAGSALALAAATMTKGFPLFTFPLFARTGGGRFVLWFLAGCLLLAAPFLRAGAHLFDGLLAYLSGWKVNAGLFVLVDWWLTPVTPAHHRLTRGLLTALLLGAVAWMTARGPRGREHLPSGVFLILSLELLLGAPVMPWYLISTAALLCWRPSPGWLLFTLTAVAQYQARRLWPASIPLLLWMGYLPVWALLLGEAAACRAGRTPPQQAKGRP